MDIPLTNRLQVILVTTPNEKTAEQLAQSILEEQIAACINIIPGLTSIYRWEGSVEKNSEVLLILKTTKARYKELEAFVLEHHPYENPEIVAMEASDVSEKYLHWVKKETAEK